MFAGEVRYARDAFEGLRLMDALMAVKRGEEGAALPAPRERRVKAVNRARTRAPGARTKVEPGAAPTSPSTSTCRPRRSGATGSSRASRWPTSRRTWTSGPPSWASGGSRARGAGRQYEELVETEGRPRLRAWLDRIHTEGDRRVRGRLRLLALLQRGRRPGRAPPRVARWPTRQPSCTGSSFPRQRRPRYLCLADFFRDRELALAKGPDVVAFHLVTMGSAVSQVTASCSSRTPTATTWSCTG